MAITHEALTKQLGELFTYSSVNQYTRIETPFLYPDGDIIDLFYKEEEEYVILSDLGETLGWLQMQTVAQRRSLKQRQLIDDICLNLDIQLRREMLMIRLKRSDNLAEAIMRLSQAAVRISDFWFFFKDQTDDEVED